MNGELLAPAATPCAGPAAAIRGRSRTRWYDAGGAGPAADHRV